MSIIIGIGGGSGAGKTTLANRLQELLKDKLSVIQFDHYCCDQSHLPMEERVKVNYDIPSSYDSSLLLKHIIDLQNNIAIARPCYSMSTHTRTSETLTIMPNEVIIVEGIMVFSNPDVFKQYDYRIFVDAAENVRFERRKRRDIVERGRTEESVTKQFYSTVKPMHDIYIEPSKQNCDLIFDNNQANGLDEEQVQNLLQQILNLVKKNS